MDFSWNKLDHRAFKGNPGQVMMSYLINRGRGGEGGRGDWQGGLKRQFLKLPVCPSSERGIQHQGKSLTVSATVSRDGRQPLMTNPGPKSGKRQHQATLEPSWHCFSAAPDMPVLATEADPRPTRLADKITGCTGLIGHYLL